MTGPDNTPSAKENGEPHRYDWSADRDPMYGVVAAVADATGRDATDVPPLNNYLDPDALETLLMNGGGPRGTGVEVTFDYDNVVVTIRDNGTLELRPLSG